MEIRTIDGLKAEVRELTYEEVLTQAGHKAFFYTDNSNKFWPEGYYPAKIEKPSYATSEFDKTIGKVTYKNKNLTGYANIWPDKERTQVFVEVEEGA